MIRFRALYNALAIGVVLATLAASPVSAQQPDEVDIKLPDADVTLHERVHDPVKVTAFSRAVSDSRINAYLRVSDKGRFAEKKDYTELVPAPKGGRVAGVPQSSPGEFDSVVIFDAKGKATRIRTVRKPLQTRGIQWSRDGRKLVLTVEKEHSTTVGFATVNIATGAAKVATVRGIDGLATFNGHQTASTSPPGTQIPIKGYGCIGQTDACIARCVRSAGSSATTPSPPRASNYSRSAQPPTTNPATVSGT